ncbi:hypothetical protein [Neisseria perflava]|uniref:hypothetical protein n=1 Tax=Neisseria perflava TaxID=33053 RepID=UPI0020A0BF7A|nr:hypothetical protein [Neisseria perflava]MCP1659726.1 hypothetical protein [Neisseria perflava]
MFKNTLFMKFFLSDTELFISDFSKMLLEYEAMVKNARSSNWGLYEPTKKFDAHFLERLNVAVEKDEFLPELQQLNWKIRKNPEALGGFSAVRMLANNAPLHMMERLYLRLNIDEEKIFLELYEYFKYRLRHNQADYAFIEYMTYPRMLDYLGISCCDGHDEETKEPHMIVTTHELRHWLPNLPWLAYFGRPYVELFGEEKLAQAPVYRVEKIGEGYLLQLTENISDMVTDYESYRAKEQAVKAYLNPNAFYKREKGYSLDILKAHLEKYTIPKPGSVFDTPEFTELRQGLAKREEQIAS